VHLHGSRADAELPGDGLALEPLGERAENFRFPLGEVLHSSGLLQPIRLEPAASSSAERSSVRLNGFWRKWSAPWRKARIADASSPWPVIMMTGHSGHREWSASTSSTPVIPGILISDMMQPNFRPSI
jgi:hypothetical protein